MYNDHKIIGDTGQKKAATYDLAAFGERLRLIRKSLFFSQSDLAEKLDVSRSFISEVESGSVRCGYDFIFKLSELFNVNLYYLVRGEGEMFGFNFPTPSLGGKQVGDPIESIPELLWYLERSALMRYNILFAATRLLLDEEERIAKEIEKFDSKTKKEEKKDEKTI
jgi:transcriptional regulator with XRE-family HTH domain